MDKKHAQAGSSFIQRPNPRFAPHDFDPLVPRRSQLYPALRNARTEFKRPVETIHNSGTRLGAQRSGAIDSHTSRDAPMASLWTMAGKCPPVLHLNQLQGWQIPLSQNSLLRT